MQFDYLKSLEIEEKINKIRWCQQGANNSKFLLSTNDKTIKLWKVSILTHPAFAGSAARCCAETCAFQVYERKVKCVSNFNTSIQERVASGSQASVPGIGWGGDLAPVGVPGRQFIRSVDSLRMPQARAALRSQMAACGVDAGGLAAVADRPAIAGDDRGDRIHGTVPEGVLQRSRVPHQQRQRQL